MSPAQCRAARALLSWTQGFLAEVAGLSLSTIVDFEKERRDVSAGARAAIKRALEDGGASFVAEDGRAEGVMRRIDPPAPLEGAQTAVGGWRKAR